MNSWSIFVTRETSQVEIGPKAWPWQSPWTGSASKQSVTSSIMFASVNTPASADPTEALLELMCSSAAAIGCLTASEVVDFLLVEVLVVPLPLMMSSIAFEEVHEWKSIKPDGLKPHSHEALKAVAPANMWLSVFFEAYLHAEMSPSKDDAPLNILSKYLTDRVSH